MKLIGALIIYSMNFKSWILIYSLNCTYELHAYIIIFMIWKIYK